MNVADYVWQRLAIEGVDTVFMVYGGAMAELADAFTRQKRIRYVCAQHEQGAAFMAEGYAKAKGGLGVALSTSGPGGHNMVAGIANCFYDSVPCLFITGQVATNLIRPIDSPARQLGFQETPIVEIVLPIVKHAERPLNAEWAVDALEMCIKVAQTGRPGPVLLDIPSDVQREEVDEARLPAIMPVSRRTYPGSAPIMAFKDDLVFAERPGILVGGGAWKARKAILKFAMKYDIPVFRTWNALDVVTDDHPCYGGTVGTYGGPGRNFGLQNCDLLLIIGCRLSGRITGGMPQSFARGAKKYIVNLDSALLDPAWQEVKSDVNVLCDAGEFINVLA